MKILFNEIVAGDSAGKATVQEMSAFMDGRQSDCRTSRTLTSKGREKVLAIGSQLSFTLLCRPPCLPFPHVLACALLHYLLRPQLDEHALIWLFSL